MTPNEQLNNGRAMRFLICINSLAVIVLAGVLFIYPPIRSFLDIRDSALREPGTPQVAWRLYRNLTPQYARWARERVAAGRAEELSTSDISGTEWPLFGSVFYLWGIENLQKAWDSGDKSQPEPRVFAKEAIVAASELVIDPKHAAWVRKHWGENYLHRENVFYRMLVIAALTSRENLLHEGAHLDMLRDQVETFASELEASRTGLLDDYPGECYPGDVMAAIMCIKRADAVLGTDHSEFISKARRAFIGSQTTQHQLPPYSASSASGSPASPARGCANSYMCLTAPELWPEQAKLWYDQHDRFFWQRRITAFGFREFPSELPRDRERGDRPVIDLNSYREPPESVEWGMDVDAGPIIAGHGVAASAFGVGAARKNGRFDHAYPLSAEMLITTWELPNGVMAAPRLLSNLSDAPYLGEAAILWLLSIQPESGFPPKTGGSIPPYVYVVAVSMLLIGTCLVLQSIWKIRQARRGQAPEVGRPKIQLGAWALLVLGSAVSFGLGHGLISMVTLLLAVTLPLTRRKIAPTGVEDCPHPKSDTSIVQPTNSTPS